MTAGSLSEGPVERCVEEYERVLAEIYDAGLGITRGDRLKAFRAVLAVAAPHYEAELARVRAERDFYKADLDAAKVEADRLEKAVEKLRAALGGTAGT